MLIVGFENIISERVILNILELESGFVQNFTSGTFFNYLAKFKMPTECRLGSGPVSALSPAEKYTSPL